MRSALLPPPGHFVFLLRQVQRAELFAGILLFLLSACSTAAPAPALPTSTSSVTGYGSITSMPTAVPTPIPATPIATAIALPAMPVRATGISFVDPLHGWILGNGGQNPSYTVALASTTDGGKTWQPLPLPSSNFDPTEDWSITSQIQGGIYFINTQDGWLFYRGLYSTHDGGLTWNYEPTDGMITQMDRAPDGTVWALEKLDDEWIVKKVVVAPYQQWRQLISNFRLPVDKFSIALADAKHAWISHSEAFELLYTDDGGSTWQNLGKPCKLGGGGWVIAVSAHTLWYACGYGGAGPWGNKLVVSSSDGGQTWVEKGKAYMTHDPNDTGPKDTMSNYGYPIGFGAISPAFAYMTLGRSSGIEITRDGAKTWEYPTLGSSPEFLEALFIDSQHGWAFEQTDIHRTVDGGRTWACTELPDNKPCPP